MDDDALSVEDVDRIDDTDVLWSALRQAKADGDFRLVRSIEGRMRQLAEQRRFAHLSVDELRRQILGISGHRQPEDLLRYSPPDSGQGAGGVDGAADTAAFNRAIKADQHVGIERTLAALLDEWRRRRAPSGDADA